MKSKGSIKILLLTANPNNQSQLRLVREVRDIRERLQMSQHRDRFVLETREAVRPGDIAQAILDVKPKIVQFSGHGNPTGSLCFEGRNGELKAIAPEDLSRLFKIFRGKICCVVLNACFSKKQANAIAENVPFVIGMKQEISDGAAIAFSVGFYKGIGGNLSIAEAYELACVEVGFEDSDRWGESSTPVLKTNPDIASDACHFDSIDDSEDDESDRIIQNINQTGNRNINIGRARNIYNY